MILFRCSDWRTHAAEEKCCCGVFVFDVELQLSPDADEDNFAFQHVFGP